MSITHGQKQLALKRLKMKTKNLSDKLLIKFYSAAVEQCLSYEPDSDDNLKHEALYNLITNLENYMVYRGLGKHVIYLYAE